MVVVRRIGKKVVRPALVVWLTIAVLFPVFLLPATEVRAAGAGLEDLSGKADINASREQALADAGLKDLSGKAASFLRQDFQTNGVRNSDNGVGSFALYVLDQAGIDAGTWRHAGSSLQDAVTGAILQDLSRPADVSAKGLAQDLLAAKVLRRTDLAEQILKILQARQKEAGFDDNIYSNITAYELLGRGGCLDALNAAWAKNYLLSQQARGADGAFHGWGSYSWKGKVNPDLMATCLAIRALSALDPQQADAGVQAVIRDGLSLLQKQQQSDGSFVAGMDDPAIDTAEVIVTLKRLGLKPDAWVSASGKSGLDYLREQVLHPDGSLGGCQNTMDAIWTLEACASLSASPVQQSQQFQPEAVTVLENLLKCLGKLL